VLTNAGIHFHLQAFDIWPVFGIDTKNTRTKKTSAVAERFALKFQPQIKIAIGLFGCQIAVLVGFALAENRSVFGVFSAAQILSIEWRQPAIFGRPLSKRPNSQDQTGGDNEENSSHGRDLAI
jgi:hypothetical protein